MTERTFVDTTIYWFTSTTSTRAQSTRRQMPSCAISGSLGAVSSVRRLFKKFTLLCREKL